MRTTKTKKMRVGVVGCGAISDIYLTNMIHNFENLEVAACCAGHLEHAKKKAEQYGIKGCTYEEILADPSIEMVVILTPAPGPTRGCSVRHWKPENTFTLKKQ